VQHQKRPQTPQTPEASFTYRTEPLLRYRFSSLLPTALHTPEAFVAAQDLATVSRSRGAQYAAIFNHSGKAVKVFYEKYLCAASTTVAVSQTDPGFAEGLKWLTLAANIGIAPVTEALQYLNAFQTPPL
jgi:hypothetical protein